MVTFGRPLAFPLCPEDERDAAAQRRAAGYKQPRSDTSHRQEGLVADIVNAKAEPQVRPLAEELASSIIVPCGR
jgi:hypothetical protein